MMANISVPEFCYVQSANEFISVINNDKQNSTRCSLFTIIMLSRAHGTFGRIVVVHVRQSLILL